MPERDLWFAKLDNLERAWREFESGRLDPTTLPFKAIVELTQNCNYRCIMCPQSWDARFAKYDPALNMSPELFARLAAELFPASIFVDLRGFGESTILPYWGEVLAILERYPFVEWHLVTNLGLPRPETWRRMVRLGFTLGISMDGASAEVFETIRRRGRFATVVANLATVADESARTGRGWLYFISTIQKRNFHEMPAIVELAAAHGLREVQFKVVQPGDGHDEGLEHVPVLELRAAVDRALDAGLARGVRVTLNDWVFSRGVEPGKVARAAIPIRRHTEYPMPKRPAFAPTAWEERGLDALFDRIADASRVSERKRCFKPFSYLYVDYAGRVGTCNHMMYPDMKVMGSLLDSSLRSIWNSPGYREFRGELLAARPTDTRCQWCFEHRLDD